MKLKVIYQYLDFIKHHFIRKKHHFIIYKNHIKFLTFSHKK